MSKRTFLSREQNIFYYESGLIYTRETIDGKGRREFSLGLKVSDFSTTEQALRASRRAKRSIITKMLKGRKPLAATLVEELCEQVIAQKKKANLSDSTVEGAVIHFRKHLVPWINDNYPLVIDWFRTEGDNRIFLAEDIASEYFAYKTSIRSDIRLFNHWKWLMIMLNHGHKRGLFPFVPEIKNPDKSKSPGKRLIMSEVQRLIACASKTMRAQIFMGSTMAMRKSEILKLPWEQVDLQRRTIHLKAKDTKTRRARSMGMSEHVYQELSEMFLSAESAYVFPSRYDPSKPTQSNRTAWKACKRRAGVKCRFHDLRHTFLSVALLEQKINPLHVAVYAGVSLAEIQKTYLHPTVEDTREVASCFRFESKQGGTVGDKNEITSVSP